MPKFNPILSLTIDLITVLIWGMTGAPVSADAPTSAQATAVRQTPLLTLTKQGPITAHVGELITYTLTVTNLSPAVFVGVTVTDSLPSGTLFVRADNGGQQVGQTVAWQFPILAEMSQRQMRLTVQTSAIAETTSRSPSIDHRPRIVGGQATEISAWPWQVALVRANEPDAYVGYQCGGALLSAEWVLTAAHCVQGQAATLYEVLVGQTDLSATTEITAIEPAAVDWASSDFDRARHLKQVNHSHNHDYHDEGQRLPIEAIIIHPDFYVTNQSTYRNDIALLKLATPADFGETVAPIAPLDSTTADLAAPDVEAVVSGWGQLSEDGARPTTLHAVTVPLVANETCNQPQAYDGAITETMLCAGDATGGRDACDGDSGSPLVVPDGAGAWRLAGLVSFGEGCARPHKYGVYTRLTAFATWISLTQQIVAVDTIVNHDYRVTTSEGVQVMGYPPRFTELVTGQVVSVPLTGLTQQQLDANVSLTIKPQTFTESLRLSYETYLPNLPPPPSGLQPIGLAYHLRAENEQGRQVSLHDGQTYEVQARYASFNLTHVDTTSLALYTYDASSARWLRESSSQVDPSARVITATPSRLETWAVFGQPYRQFLPFIIK